MFQGDPAPQVVVEEVHRLSVTGIAFQSLVRGGVLRGPVRAEPLGEKRVPVGVTEGVLVVVVLIVGGEPSLGLGERLVLDVGEVFLSQQAQPIEEFGFGVGHLLSAGESRTVRSWVWAPLNA